MTSLDDDDFEISRTVPSAERDHIQGSIDAPVILLEYADYQCSHCGDAYVLIKRLQRELGDSLCFSFRNFPLSQAHQYAEIAAQAAEAAGAQGKFWEMHDLLFEHQEALAPQQLVSYADSLGLDMKLFDEALASGAQAERVREDFMMGMRAGVNGTPTLFINGGRYDGPREPDMMLTILRGAAKSA